MRADRTWISEYTPREEVANALTHGVGAGLAVAATAVLLVTAARKGDPWRIVSFAIYGASLVFAYVASTFYHALQTRRAKAVFRRLDYAAIYFLIAGTYTPYTLVAFRGTWGWILFGLVWGAAIAGVSLKMAFFHRAKGLAVALYVVMGWLVVVAAKPVVESLPWGALAWLLAGGLCYTGGVAIFVRDDIPYNHAVWHLFVLAGSILHFFGIYLYLT